MRRSTTASIHDRKRYTFSTVWYLRTCHPFYGKNSGKSTTNRFGEYCRIFA